MVKRLLLLLTGILGLIHSIQARIPEPQFKHLTQKQGLPDMNIRSFAQDQYGFVWIGTYNGLCRFDGRKIRSYFHNRNDPFSLPGNYITSLHAGNSGRLWIGCEETLCLFEERTQRFLSFRLPGGGKIYGITEGPEGILWLATGGGLVSFHLRERRFTVQPPVAQNPLARPVVQMAAAPEGTLYLATPDGIVLYNIITRRIRLFRREYLAGNDDDEVLAIAPDREGNLWYAAGDQASFIGKLDPVSGKILEKLPLYRFFDTRTDHIRSLLTDRRGRLWIAANVGGLLFYDPPRQEYRQFTHDPLVEGSLSGAGSARLFADHNDGIWVGAELSGVSWCYPDEQPFTLFQATQDPRTSLPWFWGRAALEDETGNLWLGTGNGLSVWNEKKGFLHHYVKGNTPPGWTDVFSIRSLARGSDGAVWVGLSDRIHRFSGGKWHIYTEKDSLRGAFCWALLTTRKGDFYAGTREGLQVYNPQTDRFDSFDKDPLFGPFARKNARALFESRDGGLWIGFRGFGLVYWHRERKILRHYLKELPHPLVTSLAEDRNGILWVATIDGLARFDGAAFRHYNREEGFPSNQFAGLLFDRDNRLWTGTSAGLCCLDTDRKTVHTFTTEDGLASDTFNDQSACTLRDGRFCYPSTRGFVLFDPAEVLATERTAAVRSYLTGFQVSGRNHPLPVNPEAVREITLRPDEHFFTFEWAACQFRHPDQNRYLCQLAGFDDRWIQVEHPAATYTNIPGGDYVFRFRTSTIPGKWNGPISEIQVHIQIVYYRTWWFLTLSALLLTGLGYLLYRYRIRQALHISELQTQSARLEKNNALVRYQNLVNQLNPHFLFNSLAVLDSLIFKDQKLASRNLRQLTKVYRYLIENDGVEVIGLEKEVRFTRDFIGLLATRYGDGLQISVTIPDAALHRKIVPVTLQNLLENAIKHNTTDPESPLVIRVFVSGDDLVVQNNLQRRPQVSTSNGKGLADMQALYRHLSGRELRVVEAGGVFSVHIPFIV